MREVAIVLAVVKSIVFLIRRRSRMERKQDLDMLAFQFSIGQLLLEIIITSKPHYSIGLVLHRSASCGILKALRPLRSELRTETSTQREKQCEWRCNVTERRSSAATRVVSINTNKCREAINKYLYSRRGKDATKRQPQYVDVGVFIGSRLLVVRHHSLLTCVRWSLRRWVASLFFVCRYCSRSCRIQQVIAADPDVTAVVVFLCCCIGHRLFARGTTHADPLFALAMATRTRHQVSKCLCEGVGRSLCLLNPSHTVCSVDILYVLFASRDE